MTRALAHELDPAWIIAIWKAIHGPDPSPERIVLTEEEAVGIARQAANALVGYVAAVAVGDATQVSAEAHQTVATGAQRVGFELLSKLENEPGQPTQPRPYCFKFRGEIICVPRPKLARSPI